MAVHTSSSRADGPRRANPRAVASVTAGVAAVATVPLAVVASRYFDEVTLLQSTASAVLAVLLGLYAIVLARRGRETAQRTLGRSGGEGAARVGQALGVLALWLAGTTALAVGFYGLLTLFAD